MLNDIAFAQKVDFQKGESDNNAVITVEPLYPGYGATLGNSLRRVLLSSLPGAAVVGVKIDGVNHEFSSMADVSDDVLTIILNLKKLRLKVHSDEQVVLTLNAKGEKVVTAADIEKNSDVEVLNKDLEIATITEKDKVLEMEIFVEKGRGYETVEAREKKRKEIGYIEVDSIFSPVFNVGIKVDNTRVGKMTNWDKLILDVETDGSITPQVAFNDAIQILIDQFSALKVEETKKASKKKKE